MPKTKADIIEAVAHKRGLSISRAEMIVDLLFASMADALVGGHHVEIRGFGSFTVRSYKAYAGRNPRTGVSVHVREKRLPHFKPGKELRGTVNQSGATSRIAPAVTSGAA